MTVKRMDNVGIVVEDLDAAIGFFTELGLTLEGRMPIDMDNLGKQVLSLHATIKSVFEATTTGHARDAWA